MENNEKQVNQNKTQVKGVSNKKFIITLVICSILAIYAVVTSLIIFKPVYSTMTKKEFYAAMGDNEINIPIVEINTKKGEEPKNKVDYVDCTVSITNCDDEIVEESAGVRLRGNSTMVAPKKPYRIKFDSKQKVLGMSKQKSWVLLADYYDQSSIRNYTALTLGQYFDELDFTPNPNHVVLFMNGDFRGLYLLTDQVDEKRTDVEVDFEEAYPEQKDIDAIQPKDMDFPFLVEMDLHALTEGATGVDNFDVEGFAPVEIKYPEGDERVYPSSGEDIVFNYIEEYINAVFTSLKTGEAVDVSFSENPVTFEDLVEVETLIDYYLVNEIILNPDNAVKSIYMNKKVGEKLKFGPLWDFDYSMTTDWIVPYTESNIEAAKELTMASDSKIYNLFLQDKDNYDAVVERFNELKGKILDVCDHLRDYKSVIDDVARIDAENWYGETGVFQYGMQYDYVRLFLQDRYYYLNEAFALTHEEFLEIIN